MRLQNLGKGIGSLVEIYPSKIKLNFPKRKTPAQRMEETWIKTGKSFRKAISDYELSRRK